MPRLRLPPLPPTRILIDKLAASKNLKHPAAQAREMKNRCWLVNPTLTNRFVRELGIRENEVVIDAYAGYGALTRALLAGGWDETTPADWEKVRKEQDVVGPEAGQVRRHNSGQFTFPPWNPKDGQVAELPEKGAGEEHPVPSVVVANDPAVSCLSRGLGFFPDEAPPNLWDFCVPQPAEMMKRFQTEKSQLYPSILEKERLVFAPESVYRWPSLPNILSHELVAKHMEVYDESKEGAERYHRPWNAPPPHITMCATIQDSVLGDQLLNQWVSSVIGSPDQEHSWMWKWGRIRLAFLVSRNMYDVSRDMDDACGDSC